MRIALRALERQMRRHLISPVAPISAWGHKNTCSEEQVSPRSAYKRIPLCSCATEVLTELLHPDDKNRPAKAGRFGLSSMGTPRRPDREAA